MKNLKKCDKNINDYKCVRKEEIMMEDEKILDAEEQDGDVFEANIRPQSLKEYVGQEEITSNLKVFIEAAKIRGESLDHVLLYGPPRTYYS